MTTTQIQYWNMLESKRHNKATELQASNELAETTRHNVTTERETGRHNVAAETETVRHNMVVEGETNRHNLITEGETNRHNLIVEDQSQQSINETIRHNSKTESQTDASLRIQRGSLKETTRHNKASEGINATSNAIRQREASIKQQEANIKQYEAETHRIKANSDVERNAIQNALDKTRNEQAIYDLDHADIKLLATLGDTGKKMGIAKLTATEVTQATKSAVKWISSGSPPASYQSASPKVKHRIENVKSLIENFMKNSGNYQVTM